MEPEALGSPALGSHAPSPVTPACHEAFPLPHTLGSRFLPVGLPPPLSPDSLCTRLWPVFPGLPGFSSASCLLLPPPPHGPSVKVPGVDLPSAGHGLQPLCDHPSPRHVLCSSHATLTSIPASARQTLPFWKPLPQFFCRHPQPDTAAPAPGPGSSHRTGLSLSSSSAWRRHHPGGLSEPLSLCKVHPVPCLLGLDPLPRSPCRSCLYGEGRGYCVHTCPPSMITVHRKQRLMIHVCLVSGSSVATIQSENSNKPQGCPLHGRHQSSCCGAGAGPCIPRQRYSS